MSGSSGRAARTVARRVMVGGYVTVVVAAFGFLVDRFVVPLFPFIVTATVLSAFAWIRLRRRRE